MKSFNWTPNSFYFFSLIKIFQIPELKKLIFFSIKILFKKSLKPLTSGPESESSHAETKTVETRDTEIETPNSTKLKSQNHEVQELIAQNHRLKLQIQNLKHHHREVPQFFCFWSRKNLILFE